MSKKKVLLRGVFINRDTNGEGVLKVGTTLIRVSTVMGILYSYRKIIEKDRYKIKYFISGIILGFLAMFYGVVSSRNCMIGSGIIVMGVTVVVLPFTTPETTALFGNKKARFIGRILGMILIAVGIWVGFI